MKCFIIDAVSNLIRPCNRRLVYSMVERNLLEPADFDRRIRLPFRLVEKNLLE
jgi:hypothetical protein